MRHWVWLFALVFVPAQAATQVIVAPQHLPVRTIPDTRKLNNIRWDLAALDSIDVIDQHTDSLQIEHALCLYGYMSKTLDTLFIESALLPAEILHQSSISVSVRCAESVYFIGLVHTHIYPLSFESVMFDFRTFTMWPQLIISVIVANGEMVWFGRELFSTIWPYRKVRADLRP